MKVFYTIAVLCMATCASAKDPITVENCGKSLLSPDSADRIVGGENAKHGMYPWMVSLYANHDRWGFLCGATILNEHWVVTAAHCILYKHSPDRYKIYAGINELFDNQPTAQEHKISDIYVHEDYDTMTFSNDIALLRTSTKINIAGSGGYVNGICLPQDNNNPEGLGIVTGWGVDKTEPNSIPLSIKPVHQGDVTKYSGDVIIIRRIWLDGSMASTLIALQGGHLSNVLQRVTVPIVRCPRKPENMICAGAENKDSCKSDSGGPLLQRDENGIATLVGIVSHGTGCGLKWFPGVYTKVSYYRDWMLRTIQGKDT